MAHKSRNTITQPQMEELKSLKNKKKQKKNKQKKTTCTV